MLCWLELKSHDVCIFSGKSTKTFKKQKIFKLLFFYNILPPEVGISVLLWFNTLLAVVTTICENLLGCIILLQVLYMFSKEIHKKVNFAKLLQQQSKEIQNLKRTECIYCSVCLCSLKAEYRNSHVVSKHMIPHCHSRWLFCRSPFSPHPREPHIPQEERMCCKLSLPLLVLACDLLSFVEILKA